MLLVDKYKPKKIDELIGNKLQILKCKMWLENFKNKEKNTKPALLLAGPPGIGKTSLATLLLKNYDLIEFNASDVRNQKMVKENLKNIMGKISISCLMGSTKKIGIIMDEVDGMSSGDRGGVSELISFINPNKGKKKANKKPVKYINPIICICNKDTEKKIKDLKKECEVVKFTLPSINELYLYAEKILEKENIKIKEKDLYKIIEFSQKDIRKLLGTIQNIYINKKEKNISKVLNSMGEKKVDSYLLNTTFNILNQYNGIEQTSIMYETDKNMIGLTLFENILNFTKNYSNNDNEKIKVLKQIYKDYSYSDTLDKEIFTNCNYYLHELNAIYKCCISSYLLSTLTKNKNLRYKTNDFQFTKILSKFSQKYSNYKTKIFINDNFFYFGNCNLYGLYINIIKKIIVSKNKKFVDDDIKFLIKKYNLTPEILEKIYKLINLKLSKTKYEEYLVKYAGKDLDKKYFQNYLTLNN